MDDSVHIFAPASVANVGPGFDILGFALYDPGDEIRIEKSDEDHHTIENHTGVEIPLQPEKNVATIAVDAMLQDLGSMQKFRFTFLKKIPAGSGIGSSAASSAGAVYGVNFLLDNPLEIKELIPYAMLGEQAASGSAHADNVAPVLLGGFVLVRSYHPLDIVSIPGLPELYCTVVHPEISIATEDSRKILKTTVPLKTAIAQCGNVAGLVTGLITGDLRLIRDSMHDVIAEPIRAFLIPEYEKMKQVVLAAGALGCSISGSGPSVFALSDSAKTAKTVSDEMHRVFTEADINSNCYVSKVNQEGIRILS